MAPDAVVGRDGDDLLLRNFEGKVYRYPDPDGTLGRKSEARKRKPEIGNGSPKAALLNSGF